MIAGTAQSERNVRSELAAIRPRIAAHGYVFLHRHAHAADTLSVANELGETIVPWDDTVVQQLVPRATSTPNTYSGIFGLGRFPFHTDLAHWRRPPRYLLLRCVKGFRDVPTLLIDGRAIVEAVTPDILRRAVVRPRRPLSGEMHLMRLWQTDRERSLFRWDEVFLKPASRIGGLAFEKVREQLQNIAATSVAMAEAGDTLIIDNWRMLHSRPAIPAGREDRRLERVYLGG